MATTAFAVRPIRWLVRLLVVLVRRGRQQRAGDQPGYAGSAARTLGAVYVLAVLMVVLLTGPALKGLEVVRTRQMVAHDMNVFHEVSDTPYRELRSRLVAQMPAAGAVDGSGGGLLSRDRKDKQTGRQGG